MAGKQRRVRRSGEVSICSYHNTRRFASSTPVSSYLVNSNYTSNSVVNSESTKITPSSISCGTVDSGSPSESKRKPGCVKRWDQVTSASNPRKRSRSSAYRRSINSHSTQDCDSSELGSTPRLSASTTVPIESIDIADHHTTDVATGAVSSKRRRREHHLAVSPDRKAITSAPEGSPLSIASFERLQQENHSTNNFSPSTDSVFQLTNSALTQSTSNSPPVQYRRTHRNSGNSYLAQEKRIVIVDCFTTSTNPPSQQSVSTVMPTDCDQANTATSSNHVHSLPKVFLVPDSESLSHPVSPSATLRKATRHPHQHQSQSSSNPAAHHISAAPQPTNACQSQHQDHQLPQCLQNAMGYVMPVDLTVPPHDIETTGGQMSDHTGRHSRHHASQPVVNLLHYQHSQFNVSDQIGSVPDSSGGYHSGVGLPSPSVLLGQKSTQGATVNSFGRHLIEQPSGSGAIPDPAVVCNPAVMQLSCNTGNRKYHKPMNNNVVVIQEDSDNFIVDDQGAPYLSQVNSSSTMQTFINPVNVARLVSLNNQKNAEGANATSSNQTRSARCGAGVSSNSGRLPAQPASGLESSAFTSGAAGVSRGGVEAVHGSQPMGVPHIPLPATIEHHPLPGGNSGLVTKSGVRTGSSWSRAPSAASGRHSPQTASSGINHRISQLQQCQGERSLQLIILQDINQVLLMGFEENLVNLNVPSLVACVLEILGSEDEQLTEMKNLCCNVLTHMMDVLPRSSDAVIPSLPLLLTTMSCSFVGDILERIINLVEQLSRRHGREVLQCGAISSVLEFYDFVTLAQHRTILSMVSNCLVKLNPSDFDLIAPCLPNLAERLRESEPGCVERVCSCFARLVLAYRGHPDLLRRIVNSCNLFSNLQHLLMASPPVLLGGVRDVLLMLAIFCSCPDLAVELIKQNISATLHCILTGKPVDMSALRAKLISPVDGLADLLQRPSSRFSALHPCGQANTGSRRNSVSQLHDLDTNCALTDTAWQPLMLTTCPSDVDQSDVSATVYSHVAIQHRSPEDVHAVMQLICELLPPIPSCQKGVAKLLPPFLDNAPSAKRAHENSTNFSPDIRRRHSTSSSKKLATVPGKSRERQNISTENIPLVASSSSASLSTASSCATLQPTTTASLSDCLVGLTASSTIHVTNATRHDSDARAQLLWDQCEALYAWLAVPVRLTRQKSFSPTANSRRQATAAAAPTDQVVGRDNEAIDHRQQVLTMANDGLQLVQILLPLLFELFTETTKSQTRLLCLDAIRRLLYFSSPLLVAKVLNPSVVCSHLVGMLSSPDRTIVLPGLHIALLLIDRVPILYAVYFRKAGILYQLNRLNSPVSDSVDMSATKQSAPLHADDGPVPSAPRKVSLMSLDGASIQHSLLPTTICHDLNPMSSLPPESSPNNGSISSHESMWSSQRRLFTSPPLHQCADASSSLDLHCSKNDINWFIRVSCCQLQTRIHQVLPPAPEPSLPVGSDCSAPRDPVLESKLPHFDLMPKLCTIATYLKSSKPALWILAFNQLIDLLKPFPHGSTSRVEPPSPFELHNSGVTSALLVYLTEADHRQTRLWIFYRLFFGIRAKADRCLLPLSNQGPVSKKKPQHQTRLSFPSTLTFGKRDELDEIDTFLDSNLKSRSSSCSIDDGQEAFASLIHCLLTCFHRHEHFQVSGMPSLLPSDSELLGLVCQPTETHPPVPLTCTTETSGHSTSPSRCNSTVVHNTSASDVRPRRQSSSSTAGAISPTNRHRPYRQRSKDYVNLTTDSEEVISGDAPVIMPDTSGVWKAPTSTPLTGPIRAVPIVSAASSRSTNSTVTVANAPPVMNNPTPGLLTIELVQFSASDDSAVGEKTAFYNSFTSSPPSPGIAHPKGGRKSSTSSSPSSVNSSHRSSTSSTIILEPTPSLPSHLHIQITALATVQTIERLLLQRHSINALLHDCSTYHDHDYGSGLYALANAYSAQSPQSVSDARTSDDNGSMDEDHGEIHVGDARHHHYHHSEGTLKRSLQFGDPIGYPLQSTGTESSLSPSVNPVDVSSLNTGRRSVPSKSRQRQEDDCNPTDSLQTIRTTPACPVGTDSAVDSPHPKSLGSLQRGLRSLLLRSGEVAARAEPTDYDQHMVGGMTSRTLRRQRQEDDCNLTNLLQTIRTTPPSAVGKDPVVEPQHPRSLGSLHRGLRSLLLRSGEVAAHAEPADYDQHMVDGTTSRTLRRRPTANSNRCVGRDYEPLSSVGTPCNLGYSSDVVDAIDLTGSPSTNNSSIQSNVGVLPSSSRFYRTKQSLAGTSKNSTTGNVNSGGGSGSGRHRRLKGNSLLAAFGVLSGLSSSQLSTQPSPGGSGSGYGASGHGGQETAAAGATRRTAATTRSNTGTNASSLYHPATVSPSAPCSPSPSASSCSSNSSSIISLDYHNLSAAGSSSGLHHSTVRVKYRPPSFVFYIGGHQLPTDMPLFEAIRSFSREVAERLKALSSQSARVSNVSGGESGHNCLTESELDELAGHLIWSQSHTIRYRLVHNTSTTNTNQSHGATSSKTGNRVPNQSPLGSLLHRTGSHSSTSATPSSSRSPVGESPQLGSSSLPSVITCLKRRRSDKHDLANSADTPTSTSGGCTSRALSDSSPSHPLHTSLSVRMCDALLSDVRCACPPADCPGITDGLSEFGVTPPDGNLFGDTISCTLAVLRLLHNVSRLWHTAYDLFDPLPVISPTVFRSQKLAAKANRQLQDLFAVLAGNLPNWLIRLMSACPFLFPFETRRSFFYAHNFDRDRALLRFQDSATTSGSEFEFTHSNALVPRSTPSTSGIFTSSYPAHLQTSPSPAGMNLSLDHHFLALVGPSQFVAAHNRSAHRSSHPRGRFHLSLALSPNLRRHKVTVDRDGKRLLRQAEAILLDLSHSRAVLEIAFDGEVGFGLGPTLEFYTLVSRQLMKGSLGLWHTTGETTEEGYITVPPPGLYPRPLGNKQTRSSLVREARSKFLFLGRLMARALLDWRQLDLSFSPAFFKWFRSPTVSEAVSEGHILPTDLSLIDPDLARHMSHLVEIANRRHRILRCLRQQQSSDTKNSQACQSASTSTDKLKESLSALDSEVEDLCLTFVLPGYDIDLIKNGSHVAVTGVTLPDYLRLVCHWFVIEGASRQMEAVCEGFDSVLPGVRRRLAVLFQPDEMAGLFCGRSPSQFERLYDIGNAKESSSAAPGQPPIPNENDDEGWDLQSLTEACRCDHGYTPQSRTIRSLFEVMSEFTSVQRRLFVQFVTGSPRLPVGGFRALKPPLKIVMKRENGDNADNHLPSVMTCQNYLKLPDYSSKELLKSKLLYAIHEGQNAFHLS